MLHTKSSQGHTPSGSGEKRFLRVFFIIYGRGGNLGSCDQGYMNKFLSHLQRSLHMEFEFNWPSGFSGEV